MELNVTFLSDTHRRHKDIELIGGNILIFSGDCMGSGYNKKEFIDFINWAGEQNYTHKVFIAGNHDRWCEKQPINEIKRLFNEKGIVYLLNDMVEIEGLKIYGTPYQPYFCNWAFNVSDSNNLKNIYKMIPDGLDILITHCPPYGILDKSHIQRPQYGRTGEECLGSVELKDILEKMNVKPKICVFGHIHGDGGNVVEHDGVKYINASVCDENYEPVNKIINLKI